MSPRSASISSSGFRKRIWDIYNGYHCAIIGTCLNRTDLRKIAGKRIFALEAGSSDYQLHSALVALAGSNSPQAKALHDLLDSKFQAAINRYRRVKGDEAIEALWNMDCARGAIAGPLWAIMTSLTPSQALTHRIYGQVHMLGHDFVINHQRHLRRLHELRDKNSIFQEILVSERQHYQHQKRRLEDEIATLRLAQKEAARLLHQDTHLPEFHPHQNISVIRKDDRDEISRLKREIADLRQNSAIQCGRIDALGKELHQSQTTIAGLKKENSSLMDEKRERQQEIVTLEAALIAGAASRCTGCADEKSDRCPGPDLCGKKILYVGGQQKMVPHYQQLVENYGGRFMHHDGGVEATRNQLPKMLGSADIVFCPVDCVSHDACTCVKKMCKHYQKPFVMMRSSGLSTLAKELGAIIQ
jgi:hypothetical protein